MKNFVKLFKSTYTIFYNFNEIFHSFEASFGAVEADFSSPLVTVLLMFTVFWKDGTKRAVKLLH